jgi:hypothetical protein
MLPLGRRSLLLAPWLAACNGGATNPGTAWDLQLDPIVPEGQDFFQADTELTLRVTTEAGARDFDLGDGNNEVWTLTPVDDLAGATLGLYFTDPNASIDPLDFADLRAYGQTPPVDITTGARSIPVLVPAFGEPGAVGSLPAALNTFGAAIAVLPTGDVVVFGGTDDIFGSDQTDLGFDRILRLSRTDDDLAFKDDGRLRATDGFEASWVGARADVITTEDGARVLLSGGRERWTSTGQAHPQSLLLDPADWTVVDAPILAIARSEHITQPVADGLLVLGGWNGTGQAPALTWELYDPADAFFEWEDTYTTTEVGSIGTAWADLGAEGVMVCGGGSTALGQPDTLVPSANCGKIRADRRWASLGAIGQDVGGLDVPNRMYATLAVLPDGRVLLAGGVKQSIPLGGTAPATDEALIFDPEQDRWARAAPMTRARAMHRAVPLPDGRVLLIGGVDAAFGRSPTSVGAAIPTAEIFDPATDTFSELPALSFNLGALPAVQRAPGFGAWALAGIRPDGGGDGYAVIGLGPN